MINLSAIGERFVRWIFGSRSLKKGEIEFCVPGDPPTKDRPRFSIKGGGKKRWVEVRPTENDIHNEAVLLQAFKEAAYCRTDLNFPHDGPVRVRIYAVYSATKWIFGEKATRKDLDNIIKIVLDALNKEAYFDDGRVVGIHAEKGFHWTTGTVVVIEFYEESKPPAGMRGRPRKSEIPEHVAKMLDAFN